MLIQTHYKTQLNFTFAGLDAVKGSLQRLSDFVDRLRDVRGSNETGHVSSLLQKTLNDFTQALGDDLNISSALASLFDLVREMNTLCDANKVSQTEAEQTLNLLKKLDTVLGFLPLEEKTEEVSPDLKVALEKRNQARKEKNWALADQMRVEILSKGYTIEDTPHGAKLKKI
jgi:cysteinyl-tRNA synthetase